MGFGRTAYVAFGERATPAFQNLTNGFNLQRTSSNDRSNLNRSHRRRPNRAGFAQTGPQGLPFAAIFGAGADSSYRYTDSMETFLAPASGSYEFDVVGADGGALGKPNAGDGVSLPPELRGGKGKEIRGTRALAAGELLSIYVGAVGAYDSVGNGGGGGAGLGAQGRV